jgi:sugar lactone lactonase YvrE
MPLSLKRASIFIDGLDHPECITTGPDGTFYAGGEAGQIYRISADGKKLETIATTSGFILGVTVSPDGKFVYACDLVKKSIFKLELGSRTLTLFADKVDGKPISIPNHLCFDRQGNLYVTDSGAFRKVNGRILKFDREGNGVVWHEGPFNFANGIAIGPDGAVYVVCTWLSGVERIDVKPDGSAGKRSVYAKLKQALPDGLAFDAKGNLYVSCYTPARIYKVTTKREVSILIDDWEAHTLSNPTNLCFGGPNFDQLFAANLGRWHLTKIDLRSRGFGLACHWRDGK